MCTCDGSKAALCCAGAGAAQFHPSLLAEPEMDTVCQTKDLDNELDHKNGNLFFLSVYVRWMRLRQSCRQLTNPCSSCSPSPSPAPLYPALSPSHSLSLFPVCCLRSLLTQCIFRGSNYFRICWPLECYFQAGERSQKGRGNVVNKLISAGIAINFGQ